MTSTQIRQVLSANLGKSLTPELACEIELAALKQPGEAIDPASLGATHHRGYEIRAERLAEILTELHPLHVAHWGETEKHRHGLPLNPDYLAMTAMEQSGRLIQFTVRHGGALVGNLRMYLGVSLHSQTRYASEDTLFLLPEHRGGFLVMALIRFAEGALRSIGISEIRVTSKLVNNADVLMRRMKYQPVALEFVKFFHEE